jgi:hypothetical protein
MTELRKAAEQALEALEIWEKMQPNTSASAVRVPAIQALRQALDLQTTIEKGTKAWADVPNATEWAEELRGNTPDCKTHPDAPHGFDRNASHSADRYVCECEGWEPPKREWVGLTKEDFYKKDDETVFVLGMKFAEARLKEKNA